VTTSPLAWPWQQESGSNRRKDEALQAPKRLSRMAEGRARRPITASAWQPNPNPSAPAGSSDDPIDISAKAAPSKPGLPARTLSASSSRGGPRATGQPAAHFEQPGLSATLSATEVRSGPTQPGLAGTPDAAREFIVFLDDAPGQGGVAQRAQALLRSLGVNGQPTLVFDQLNGFTLQITDQQARRLRALGGVRSVEADAAVFLDPPILNASPTATLLRPQAAGTTSLTSYGNSKAGSGETLPWGVRAVWQGDDISTRGNFASDTYAFVIDSGVLSTTGDLNLADTSSWHRSWISGESAFTDGNGHGSHVAGTIAALANGQGVVGVAPGANVVSLKVFDSSGGGASYSSIIDAINHAVAVINNNGLNKSKAVINMSLGGSFSSSLDMAVKNAAGQGILFSLAAGNNGDDVDKYSPAAAGGERNPNVFTVSAVDSAYRMPSWSNWDRIDRRDKEDNVDMAAPGVSVLSYYRDGQLAYLSGTSMAAPHLAGLLLAGGVQAGALVTPYYTGTADPFALGVPSTSGPTDPEPDPEPVPEPSTDLILWGTTGNDAITGGSGNDRLSGVLATGTTAAAMGAGQIDVLTGGAGADIFVLGDSRGVFYDDRQNNNLGTEDYALIKDFRSGEDKLQLRESSYLFTVSSNNLSLYWDRNGNGKLDTGGRNRDELIAVLEGVSGLSSGDILWV
jgi:subtilisin family serine protease